MKQLTKTKLTNEDLGICCVVGIIFFGLTFAFGVSMVALYCALGMRFYAELLAPIVVPFSLMMFLITSISALEDIVRGKKK